MFLEKKILGVSLLHTLNFNVLQWMFVRVCIEDDKKYGLLLAPPISGYFGTKFIYKRIC